MRRRAAYTGTVKYLAFVAVCGSLVSSATAIQNNGRSSELNEILNQMRAHDIWQNRHLVEYQLRRRFYAAARVVTGEAKIPQILDLIMCQP